MQFAMQFETLRTQPSGDQRESLSLLDHNSVDLDQRRQATTSLNYEDMQEMIMKFNQALNQCTLEEENMQSKLA